MAENLLQYCFCLTAAQLPAEDRAKLAQRRAALLKNASWQTGDQITIRFLEGDPGLQTRVRNVASEWMKVANLNLVFTDQAPTDIRIAFQQGNGSWSYIGTTCRQIAEPQPTMNYGWLTPASAEQEVRRVVLHEFGHAIGLIHEHQNPQHAINWNKPAVIHDLSGPPNNWDEATIDTNMFKFYQPGEVDANDVDPVSIMMYPIPKSWTTDGFSAGLNGELSDMDKSKVRSHYPR
jgi:serralysin